MSAPLSCPVDSAEIVVCPYSSRTRRFEPEIKELETLGGVPVSTWYFRFAEGRLLSVEARIPRDQFSELQAVVQGQHGKPVIKQSTIRTENGAQHDQITHTWKSGSTQLVLSRYAETTDLSAVSLTSHEMDAVAKKVTSKKAASKTGDL